MWSIPPRRTRALRTIAFGRSRRSGQPWAKRFVLLSLLAAAALLLAYGLVLFLVWLVEARPLGAL